MKNRSPGTGGTIHYRSSVKHCTKNDRPFQNFFSKYEQRGL